MNSEIIQTDYITLRRKDEDKIKITWYLFISEINAYREEFREMFSSRRYF